MQLTEQVKYALGNRNFYVSGTDNPNVYFVIEFNPKTELDSEGFLQGIFSKSGLNENNCRFARFVPNADSTDFDNIINDVVAANPKVVVTLGGKALNMFFPENKDGITKIRGEIKYFNNSLSILPTLHPYYILRQTTNNQPAIDFNSDIKAAVDYVISGALPTRGEPKDNLSKTDHTPTVSETRICLTYSDFEKFCADYGIDEAAEIGFDVETNAEYIHSNKHRVVGFSLAKDKYDDCYVPLNSLDYKMPDEDVEKIKAKMRQYLTTKNVLVYNCQHEYPAALNWLDVEIKRLDDLFVLVKLMMGNSDRYLGGGGLKLQCQMYLNKPDWSEDLDKYFTYLLDYSKYKYDMQELLQKYYGDDYPIIKAEVENTLYTKLSAVKPGTVISYEYVPYKLIGRYGGIDASVLFELRDYYREWMERMNKELSIDLQKGYECWMMHHYAGYVLEKNGAYWNEDYAKEVEKWCKDSMKAHIVGLFKSPLSEKLLKEKSRDAFLIYLKDNYAGHIFGNDYTISRNYKATIDIIPNTIDATDSLKRMSLQPKKNGAYKLELGNFLTLSRKFLSENTFIFPNWYNEFIKDLLYSEDKTEEDLKVFLNPNATSVDFRNAVSDILITPEMKIAKTYTSLVDIIEKPEYNLDDYKDMYDITNNQSCNYMRKSFDFNLQEFLSKNLNTNLKDSNDSELLAFVDSLRVDQDMTAREKFDKFSEHLLQGKKYSTWKVNRAINSSMSFTLESLDGTAMNEIYELFKYLGNDVENKETWSKEFKWFVDFKMYKKFAKLISTYIDGKVGRGNAYYVDKTSLENDYFTRREESFDTKLGVPDGKAVIMQQKFGINHAETGRWKSGMHNIPAGETMKKVFTSRFKGGCVMMPDGAQMEIRVLAAESKDENLLQAFQDKLDIHRFFASKIYDVEYDAVEKWQRGIAKNAVFGMIYGESEKAFADSYLGGDVNKAREVFSAMFNGFPRLKEYIERARNQYLRTGKVTTLTNRYIDLAAQKERNAKIDDNAVLRQAQNYPIQGVGEDVAGVVLYKVCEQIKNENMKSKPFCFIHDSIEVDCHPDEVFKLVDSANYLFNHYLLDEYGVPAACDVPLGPSMGQEIEVKDLKHFDESYNEVTFKFEGFIDDIEEMVSIWKGYYDYVDMKEIEEEPDQDIYIPYSTAFLPTKASISMKMGTSRKFGVRNMHIIRKRTA